MKKVALLIVFFAGFINFSKAQNSFEVVIGHDICLDQLTLKMTDGSTRLLDLGCTGDYNFDIGDNTIEFVIINGVICNTGQTTDVFVNNHVSTKATLTESKTLSVPSPREINDPGQTL